MVRCDHSELLKAISLAIVASNKASKNSGITKINIKVGKLTSHGLVNYVVVVAHPFKQNSFSDGVDIRFGHWWINDSFLWWYTRKCLKVLRGDPVQVIDSQYLVENC